MAEKRDTIGKVSTKLAAQTDYYDKSTTVIDQRREMQKDFEKNVYEAISRGLQQYTTDFYVVVETKKERLMPNVLRNYFFTRSSCPTPTYDQTVYHYVKNDDAVNFLWVIPCKEICEEMRTYALDVIPEEKDLLHYVLMFYDNTLLNLSKKLNKEFNDSPLLVS